MFNRKEIMERSWDLSRQGYSASDALKMAWAEARMLRTRMEDETRRREQIRQDNYRLAAAVIAKALRGNLLAA